MGSEIKRAAQQMIGMHGKYAAAIAATRAGQPGTGAHEALLWQQIAYAASSLQDNKKGKLRLR